MSQESTNLLDAEAIAALKGKKSLLAFSGGVDSTALFFLLEEAGVEFDIALVNYNTRESSKAEEAYAKELSSARAKRCFTLSVSPPTKNFEAEARRIRYEFFEQLIKDEGFDALITAHQLNDRLEWFLMRLSKGAGIRELVGGGGVQKREGYLLVKPLLKTTKKELYDYLQNNGLKYFEDESNSDVKYERNRFRREFATPFVDAYKDGVRSSFDILEEEAALFDVSFFQRGSLIAFRSVSHTVDISNIALALKKIGYLPSIAQRKEIGRNYDAVVGGSFCVSKNENGVIFVSLYVKNVMEKRFKEECRAVKIPPKVRGYLSVADIKPKEIATELAALQNPI